MEPSDHTLVELAKQGDRTAVDQLLRRHEDFVRRTLYRQVGSSPEVEDLRQIVMLRVVGAIADFREDATFLTWLRGICTNVVRDDWRAKRACRLTPTEQLDLESTVVAPDTAVSARERLAQAGAALEQLRRSTARPSFCSGSWGIRCVRSRN